MIEARKSKSFEQIFHTYNKYYLLRRHFHSLTLRGTFDHEGTTNKPILYIMNHSSWWDGLLAYYATRTCSRNDHYIMMDEKQMNRYPFFRKIGAFSIDKTSLRGIIQSLHYAGKLLDRGACVWLFPQGEIYHSEVRPLHFQSGCGYLLAECEAAAVVPVTMISAMLQHQKPDASLWAGEPIFQNWKQLGRKKTVEELRISLENQLNVHRQLVISEQNTISEQFIPILEEGRSTNDIFDDFRKKVGIWKSFF